MKAKYLWCIVKILEFQVGIVALKLCVVRSCNTAQLFVRGRGAKGVLRYLIIDSPGGVNENTPCN